MVTIEEVKAAVLGIDNGKAPGPDGFGAMFFKRSWDIIGSDVFAAVTEFFRSARCVLQIDLQKAFDTVDWEFLREALHAFAFPGIFITWVMECVSSTSFSVMVNGQLQGLFQGRRGLRQGDPLSPFLFTICMEVFARGLRLASHNPGFHFHPSCEPQGILHLAYADDLLLFSRGDASSVALLLDSLSQFGDMAGSVALILEKLESAGYCRSCWF
ncbi:hypothetical protein F511_33235 [Dorcoceras hygrometricum]|uniref:Reverse transcriptase domain-containing protein n=1 Tax=Dorcoceras hygrometricum TaxID=472368 RepID=A0A2Z7BT00_9LAMI|nr:hypothetical protein F511_33235 [Dorcoceras hygrometricum]